MAKLGWHPPSAKDLETTFYNTAKHSPLVHEGVERMDGSQAPERRYMTVSVEELNVPETFDANFRQTKSLSKAFWGTAAELHELILENITDERWDWDRTTRRRSGQKVDSPRDIYDQGTLYSGQDYFPKGGSGNEP